MSADWFCKIGEKKIGPLNGQQLKTIVARGQLKPDHLVRRGSEGPWVAAGRIKGLFPEGTAAAGQSEGKKSPPATGRPVPKAAVKPGTPPTAKPSSLPTAAEAPAPPVAGLPQEFTLGGHDKHTMEMNVDNLYTDSTPPAAVSRRKVKAGQKTAGVKGLRKDEQKKLTVLLVALIGGGLIGVVALVWVVFSNMNTKPNRQERPNAPVVIDPIAAEEAKRAAKQSADKKPSGQQDTENWKKASVEETVVGNVVLKVLKPLRGAPPKGAKTEETDVLIVPVNLSLQAGAKSPVELTSWADDALKKKVLLRDDLGNRYELLDQIASSGDDGKAIPTDKRIQVQLIFWAPVNKKLKYLHLALPPGAFHSEGPMIYYTIDPGDITNNTVKSTKPEENHAGAGASKGDK